MLASLLQVSVAVFTLSFLRLVAAYPTGTGSIGTFYVRFGAASTFGDNYNQLYGCLDNDGHLLVGGKPENCIRVYRRTIGLSSLLLHPSPGNNFGSHTIPFCSGQNNPIVLRTRTRGQENYLRIDDVTGQLQARPDFPARLNLRVRDSPGSLLGWVPRSTAQEKNPDMASNKFGFDVPPSSQGESVPLRILTQGNWDSKYRAVIVWSDEDNMKRILSQQQKQQQRTLVG